MALDFTVLCPQIEGALDETERAYQSTPGMILTEDDLKCILFNKLSTLQDLCRPVPTQDDHILATYVHAELSWYGEIISGIPPYLSIKPDITILDPEHLSILHGYLPSPPWQSRQRRRQRQRTKDILGFFSGKGSLPHYASASRPLPSKQFEFGGKAITFELKFARQGINRSMLKAITVDYEQIKRLFGILDGRGEGHTIFSYLVVFDKYQQSLDEGPFAEFLRRYGSSQRHKIIYKTGKVTRRLT